MEKRMENLTKLSPTKFMMQTARMAKAVEKWFEVVDPEGIKKANLVKPLVIPEGCTAEKEEQLRKAHKQELGEKTKNYIMQLINSMFWEHPAETVEVLALACSVEPKDAEKYSAREYMAEISEMLNDEVVLGFFISSMQLLQKGMSRP